MHVQSFLPILGLTLVTSTYAHSLKHSHFRRDLQVSNGLPEKWTYSGCYTDSTSARGLNSYSTATDDMTEVKCIEICDQKGYSYAGVEYSRECYCGYAIQSTSVKATESSCNTACAGDSSAPCGGPDRLSIFTNGSPAPVENPGVDDYTSLSCYTDSQTARTLSEFEPTSDNIVFVRSCVDTCLQKGFLYAGVEYGEECYCGNTIQNSNTPTSPSACNMPCTGNKTELCGGSNAINLYKANSGSGASSSTGPTNSPTSTSNTVSTTSTMTSSSVTPSCCIQATDGSNSPGSIDSHYTSVTLDQCKTLCDNNNNCLSYEWENDSTNKFCKLYNVPVSQVFYAYATGKYLCDKTCTAPYSPPSSTSSSTSTTSTGRPYCKYNNPPGGLLSNAGFEESYGLWSASWTSGQGLISVQPNDYAYAGCSELMIQPTSTSGYIEFRLTQSIATTLIPGQAYTVSFYVGRRSTADSEATPPTIGGYLGQTYFGYGVACEGTGCKLPGQHGGSVYNYMSFPVTYQGGGQTLQIVVVYSGNPPYAPLLFDNFYLTQTNN